MLKKFSEADKILVACKDNFPQCLDNMDYETKLHVFKYLNMSAYEFRYMKDTDKQLFLQVSLEANKSYNSYFYYISNFNVNNLEVYLKEAKNILTDMTEEESKNFSWKYYLPINDEKYFKFFNKNPKIKKIYLNTFFENNNYDKFIKGVFSFCNYGSPTTIKKNYSPSKNSYSIPTILNMFRFVNWQVSDECINDLIYVHFVYKTSSIVYNEDLLTVAEKQRIANAFIDLKQLREVKVIKYILSWLNGALTVEQEEMLIKKFFYKNAFTGMCNANVENFLKDVVITHERNKNLFNTLKFTNALKL